LKLARARLNFRPSIKLDDGLRLTLQRDARFQPTQAHPIA
jgi:hypothetical protein